jgi:TonB family protein
LATLARKEDVSMAHIENRNPIVKAVLLVAVASACSAFGRTSKLQVSSADNPREVLKKSEEASRSARSYRVRIESPDAAGIVEYVSPDRWHSIGKNDESIVIGYDAYRKEGGGPWRRKTYGFVAADRQVEELIKLIDKGEAVEQVGREDGDGVPTLVYRRTFNFGGTPNRSATVKVRWWIAEADAMLRKVELDCEQDSIKATTVFTYYDYNADIKIERPKVMEGVAPEAQTEDYTLFGSPKGAPGDPRNTSPASPPDRIRGAAAVTVDQKPEPLNNPRPNYTEEARKNGIQGFVVLSVLVGADGAVKQVRIVRGLPDGLNEEAIRTAYGTRFKPAMKDGKAVAFWYLVQIEFHL